MRKHFSPQNESPPSEESPSIEISTHADRIGVYYSDLSQNNDFKGDDFDDLDEDEDFDDDFDADFEDIPDDEDDEL